LLSKKHQPHVSAVVSSHHQSNVKNTKRNNTTAIVIEGLGYLINILAQKSCYFYTEFYPRKALLNQNNLLNMFKNNLA
jgi:hypothetical protein